tara:strand:+ start:1451 stop:2323 length:873 start_codon:yes stop_codon:yes gene_type:complete
MNIKNKVIGTLFLGVVLCVFYSLIVFAQGGISVGMIAQDPDPVMAGDVVEVKFKVENMWKDTKEEVFLEIMPEYPFSIYSGSDVRNLGRLEGRKFGAESIMEDFKLLVDKGAVDGDHNLDMRIKFGETVILYEDMFFIDVENEEIRLRSYVRSSDFITAGDKGKFSIEFVNAGGYNVEFLEVYLEPSEDYKLLSTSNYVYVGDLDSDDTESEEFLIYVPSDVGSVDIPIKMVYEVNDYVYETKDNLKLDLLSREEAKNIGLIKESYRNYVIVGLLIGIVLVLLLRRKLSR